MHAHWKKSVDIFYIIKGNGIFHINNRIISFNIGDIIVTGYNDIYYFYFNSIHNNEYLSVNIDLEFIESRTDSLSTNNQIYLINSSILSNPVKTDTENGATFKNTLFNIHNELQDMENSYELILKGYVHSIIGNINRYFIKKPKKKSSIYSSKVIKSTLINTCKLIDDNYKNKIYLKDVAKNTNQSLSQFHKVFSEATGLPFIKYLNLFRIQKSLELIFSDIPLSDISKQCGFGSMSSFIRVFKQFQSLTPKDFRKKYTR
jgi:AraC-like DNA-binding protein